MRAASPKPNNLSEGTAHKLKPMRGSNRGRGKEDFFEWSTGYPEVTEPPERAPGTFWIVQEIIGTGWQQLSRLSDRGIIHGVTAVPWKIERYCREHDICPEERPPVTQDEAGRAFDECDWNPDTFKREYGAGADRP
jgi:hypothetical protein